MQHLESYLQQEAQIVKTVREPIFFTWRVAPTVIYGRHQVRENELDEAYCKQQGIRIVQRASGGGCVYADEGNVMLSYISPSTKSQEVFAYFLNTVVKILQSMGLPAVTTTHNDILVNGHKVSGAACYTTPTGTVVHSTMLYDVNIERMTRVLTPSQEKLQKHAVESVRQRVVNLKEICMYKNVEDFQQAIEDGWVRYAHDGSQLLTPIPRESTADFSVQMYRTLLFALKEAGYQCMTFEQYCRQQPPADSKIVILRHDVDKRPTNSVRVAAVEQEMGITASYYFRIVPESNNPQAIRAIASMGHEIGYHYEDMALCKGDKEKAYRSFLHNLSYFRSFYPVTTICMHGAPVSAYDGRDLWRNAYDYRKENVIGEPYFDIDFDTMLYLTDTGMRWDGFRVSVRDKVPQQSKWVEQGLVFHTTSDIIRWLHEQHPTTNIMITTHPQRWSDNRFARAKEYTVQYAKNMIKRFLIWAKG